MEDDVKEYIPGSIRPEESGEPYKPKPRRNHRRLRPEWIASSLVAVAILVLIIVLLCRACSSEKPETEVPDAAVPVLTLSETQLTLAPGATCQLKLNGAEPGASVIWSSSSFSVASVNATGLVTAKKVGAATIAAASGGYTASCTVRVTDASDTQSASDAPVPETGELLELSFPEPSLSVATGNVVTLALRTMPADFPIGDVDWSSSNPAVAEVRNGVVTTLTPGVTTVSALCGTKAATCIITVKDEVVEVKSVTLDQTKLALIPGARVTVNASVSPLDATDQSITWSSDHPDIASVSNGIITAKKPGSAAITAQVGGKSAVCSITVENVYDSASELYTDP